MDTGTNRMIGSTEPTVQQLRSHMGPTGSSYWRRLREFIRDNYPGIFSPEWLYGGKKHGWSLRYKKGKSFCTLIPEKGRCCVVIVLGADSRKRFEGIRKAVSKRTQEACDSATTYHDGKWVLMDVADDWTLRDVEEMLVMKRKPKKKA